MPRTKEFEPDAALGRAMELFWRKGYKSTSTRDLQKAMGISYQSMYDTFGDKHSLFLKALDRYSQQFAETPISASDASLDAIRGQFQMNLDHIALRAERKSCLWANTALELAMSDEAVAERLAVWLRRLEDAFHRALTNALRSGELKTERDLRGLARFLTTNVLGMGIMARGGASEEALREIAEIALSVLA